MIITRTNPLRKVIRRDDGGIVLVGVLLPGMTVNRKHLRVASAERVRHAEAHLIAWLGLEDWCLRVADLRRCGLGRIRQSV